MAQDFTSIFKDAQDILPEDINSSLSRNRENALRELELIGLPNSPYPLFRLSSRCLHPVLEGLNIDELRGELLLTATRFEVGRNRLDSIGDKIW